MIDIDALRRRYQALDDERLWQIAAEERSALTREAAQVLDAEIRSRGTLPDLEALVEAQDRTLDPAAMAGLVSQVRSMPCPECGMQGRPLNAATIATAMSFVFWTTYRSEVVLACPDCLSLKARKALRLSLLLGLWGIPWGPIATIRAVWRDSAALNVSVGSEPSKDLLDHVEENRAALTVAMERGR